MTDAAVLTRKRKRISDKVFYVLIYASAAISVLLLVGIIAYVFVRRIGSVNPSFLFTVKNTLTGSEGILGNIVNTLYIVLLTLLIATPIGVGSAIYLNEYAKPGIITGIILAVGRIVGESAALLFTAGSRYDLPKAGLGILDKIFQSVGSLTVRLYLDMQNADYNLAFGNAVILLLIVFAINMLTKYLANKFNVHRKE